MSVSRTIPFWLRPPATITALAKQKPSNQITDQTLIHVLPSIAHHVMTRSRGEAMNVLYSMKDATFGHYRDLLERRGLRGYAEWTVRKALQLGVIEIDNMARH